MVSELLSEVEEVLDLDWFTTTKRADWPMNPNIDLESPKSSQKKQALENP